MCTYPTEAQEDGNKRACHEHETRPIDLLEFVNRRAVFSRLQFCEERKDQERGDAEWEVEPEDPAPLPLLSESLANCGPGQGADSPAVETLAKPDE